MSPQEIAKLYRIAFAHTADQQQARRCVEAYLAGTNRLLPLQRKDNHEKKQDEKIPR
jgi:hypothetical protein